MTFFNEWTMIETSNYKKIYVSGNKLVFESYNDRQVFVFADEEMAKFIFEGMKAALKRGDEIFDTEVPF